MPQLVIALSNLQKVEFKTDPNKCNVAFKNYKAAGNPSTLVITDVPAGAGTMLGAVSSAAYFDVPDSNPSPVPATPRPVVMIEHGAVTSVGGVDQAPYAGRIELREFA